jgi:type IX secretion system PorP/SprF family membrane protein
MKRLFNLSLLLLITSCVYSQLVPVTDQYVLNPMTINPSCAGNRGALNIAAFFRKQWVGVTGAPETLTLSADAPMFDEKIGLGLIIINDKVGVTRETQFNSNYAYKIDIGEGSLSFGLGAGVITTNTAWSDLVVLDPGDELYLINSRRFVVPSFSFGTYYSYHNYFAGFSVPKFLSYKFNYDKNKYSLMIDPGQYNFILNTGYLFKVSSKVKILPSTLLIYTPGKKILFDLNAHVNYIDRFWAGLSYRNGRSLAGLFQFQINDQLRIAYTYDFDFGKLRTYSVGSHEIMLRYEFKYKVDVVNPLVF